MKNLKIISLSCFLLLASCLLFPKPSVTIKDIQFSPINAPSFQLANLKDFRAVVIAMRERDCPISEKYGPRLALIEEDYSKKGIKFIFIYVGQISPNQNAKKDLEKFKFKSPYIIDKNQNIIKALDVKTTGDVFILDSNLKKVYRGPVDDQFHLLRSAIKPKNHYVKDVLKKLLSDEKIILKELPAPGCIISKPIKKKVYFKDVAPIFNAKCLNCHSGGKTLIEFKDYESIYGRRAMVKHVIENKLMPPWSVSDIYGPWADNPSLNSKEKQMLLKWLDEDLPYKNKKIKLFNPYKKDTIINPDYVIKLDKPFKVSATGFIPYRREIFTANFSEDKYLKEIEFITKPKVIHHVLVFSLNKKYLPELKKGSKSNWHDKELTIEGWVPGTNSLKKQPKGAGIKVPKDSAIIVRIHYEPIGKEVIDTETSIKFKFYSKPPKYLSAVVRSFDKKLNIPAFSNNYRSEIFYKLKKDMILKGVFSHMHLRGKRSMISIQDPEGNETEIFDLNPFFFNFQRPFFF